MAASKEDFFTRPDEFIEEIRSIFQKEGLKGLNRYITKDLDKWKDVYVNVAVIGASGAGKSAFINAIRGLSMRDDTGAEEGVVETTTKESPYMHPNNQRLILWDFPGTCTRKRKTRSYAEEMNFKKYDFFIIVSATRFSEIDYNLVENLDEIKKPFFFVRSKLQHDIDSDKTNRTQTVNREFEEVHYDRTVVIQKIRKHCTEMFTELGFPKKRVYLIDSHIHNDFELIQLKEDLLEYAPVAKREALIFSLSFESEKIIEKKVVTLKERIWKTALKASFRDGVPGASLFLDGDILFQEAQFYQKQLGLDEVSLSKQSEALEMSVAKMKESLNLENYGFSALNIAQIFFSIPLGSAYRSTLWTKTMDEFIMALIGSRFTSYNTAQAGLGKILDSMENDAKAICKAMEKKNSKSCH